MYNIPYIHCLKMDKLEQIRKLNPGCLFIIKYIVHALLNL